MSYLESITPNQNTEIPVVAAPTPPEDKSQEVIDRLLAQHQAQDKPVEVVADKKAERKEFLNASRLAREAKAEQKKAQEMSEKADHFKKATENWKDNPYQLLEAAGIDKSEYIQTLANLGSEPEEESEAKKAVKETLEPWIKAWEEEKNQKEQQRLAMKQGQAVMQNVIPILQDYEEFPALLSYTYDENKTPEQNKIMTAIEVFNTGQAIWTQEKLQFKDQAEVQNFFKEIAVQLEDKISERVNKTLEWAKARKKYSNHFTPTQQRQVEEALGYAPSSNSTPSYQVSEGREPRPTNLPPMISGKGNVIPSGKTTQHTYGYVGSSNAGSDDKLDALLSKYGIK